MAGLFGTAGLFAKTMWRGLQVGSRDIWRGSAGARRAGFGALTGAAYGLASDDTSVLGGAMMGAAFAGPGWGLSMAGRRAAMGALGQGAGKVAAAAFRGVGRESLSMLRSGANMSMQFGSTMSRAFNGFRALR